MTIKVAIVNDMTLPIEALKRVVSSSPRYEIVWIARNGAEAVFKCGEQAPDIILMDLIMPVMDGVEATRRIMARTPCAILVVTATVSGNSDRVFEAMGYGALDAVNTPTLGLKGDVGGGEALLVKMGIVARLLNKGPVEALPELAPVTVSAPQGGAPLIVIGSSTGGPQALGTILGKLPAQFPVPIVIVQHVDAQFAEGLASWLSVETQLKVNVAAEGDMLLPGKVWLAGTNDHLILTRERTLSYTPNPAEMYYRPSVDVFFGSVVQHWPGKVLGVILTGMGRDGAKGLLAMRQRGFDTVAQDEATSVVYGMPKAAMEMKAAGQILPVERIGQALKDFAAGSAAAVS